MVSYHLQLLELTFKYKMNYNKFMIQYGFGAMRLPLTDETDFESVDRDETQKMIDSYMESGYNFFDTAYPYHNGESERILKECPCLNSLSF